ncbi:MAG: Asp-tRNA(Asn)/Glu-tRNA(Gln) amidotransferase subunit GatC [Clostridiales bacterium]|jgi:aspartyl-tRNA(Asn)/glutamyl-tRNA(Gln) amidotransferase subunit C|nr:Asp-tRNA(Asn)/Glu-tRNA(Gln) amidotransferase subunit GatC [Clostridiales bacterium]
MKVTRKEVERIAALGRLELSEEQKREMEAHLSGMTEHFKMLDAVDTSSVPPTAHILDKVNVLRPDKAEPSFERDALLANAPERDGECYIVPRAVE